MATRACSSSDVLGPPSSEACAVLSFGRGLPLPVGSPGMLELPTNRQRARAHTHRERERERERLWHNTHALCPGSMQPFLKNSKKQPFIICCYNKFSITVTVAAMRVMCMYAAKCGYARTCLCTCVCVCVPTGLGWQQKPSAASLFMALAKGVPTGRPPF
jgi:hypothetical protein